MLAGFSWVSAVLLHLAGPAVCGVLVKLKFIDVVFRTVGLKGVTFLDWNKFAFTSAFFSCLGCK